MFNMIAKLMIVSYSLGIVNPCDPLIHNPLICKILTPMYQLFVYFKLKSLVKSNPVNPTASVQIQPVAYEQMCKD